MATSAFPFYSKAMQRRVSTESLITRQKVELVRSQSAIHGPKLFTPTHNYKTPVEDRVRLGC